MKQKRINIGLLVSDLENDFDNAVSKGVMEGAKEVDANLFIIPGRYLKGQYNDKERSRDTYQYNTLFSYVNKNNIDVLLVLLGTIGTVISEREKKVFLDMYQDIPVVLIASEMDGYPNIIFDNKSGFRLGIENLINNKHCKNIGFVSGPITNGDAIERLETYKDTLAANNIPFDDSKIVYGNFSEYTEDIVSELFIRHPNLDGIVFANDQMAIGGYKVIKKLGKTIGHDILVMGFDDSPVSTTLVPNLTTVRADAEKLGRLSAIEAVNYYTTGNIKTSFVDTTLVKRDSSGDFEGKFVDKLIACDFESIIKSDYKEAASVVLDITLGDAKERIDSRVVEYGVDLAYDFFINVSKNKLDPEKAFRYIELIMDGCKNDMFALRSMFKIFDALKESATNFYIKNMDAAGSLLYEYMSHVTTVLYSKKYRDSQITNELLFMANSIAKDMLIYGENNDMSYYTVNDKLIRLGFKSSYLYSFRTPYVNKNSRAWHDWQIPSKILIKSYFEDGNTIQVVKEKNQEIDSVNVFDHKYMPKDRRFSMVLNSIFINSEQLGLILCEIEADQFRVLKSVLGQLSSAYKIMYMLRVQSGIQEQLKLSLDKIKESNEMLETISKKDELTNVYNRRGFFEVANKIIEDENSEKKRGIIIFADLDNLKTINDEFGHDEGDYAIRTAAFILKESLRNSDIVARIGGDEFAAFALTDASITGEDICKRIKMICDRFNVDSGKKYYVELSVGYSEFECNASIEIEKYLEIADEMLYEDKKEKRLEVKK